MSGDKLDWKNASAEEIMAKMAEFQRAIVEAAARDRARAESGYQLVHTPVELRAEDLGTESHSRFDAAVRERRRQIAEAAAREIAELAIRGDAVFTNVPKRQRIVTVDGALMMLSLPKLELEFVLGLPPIEYTVTKARFGGVIPPQPHRIISWDWPEPGPGAESMRADGWVNALEVWLRKDGGRISAKRQRSGRYAERLPTNRKRKRERGKANRKARREGYSTIDEAHR